MGQAEPILCDDVEEEKKPEFNVLWSPHPGPQTNFLSRQEDIVLYGGTKGPGKTDALLMEALRQVDKKGYKAIILRRTFPRLQEIMDRAEEVYPKVGGKWYGAESRFVFPSGASIKFGHCNNEKDKLNYQGHEYAFIGFDQLEEFTESQFTFICMQNRTGGTDVRCYIRATANPGGPGHAFVKRRFITGRKPGQTYFEEFPLADGKKMTRTSCFISGTVHDNPTLLAKNPGYLANLMSLPELEKQAFFHGNWNAYTLQCVFDSKGMNMQERRIREPLWNGRLVKSKNTYRVEPDYDGPLEVFTLPDPLQSYVLSADVAEGDPGGDWSCGQVLNKQTREVVAHFHDQLPPDEFGEVLYDLGMWYNTCEIAQEINGPGRSTFDTLNRLEYPHVYVREEDGKKKKKGWRTDASSRAMLVSTLLDCVKDGNVIVNSRKILDQMYDFIRPENRPGHIEARAGCNDDCVITLGIALQVVRVNPFHAPPPNVRESIRDLSPVASQRVVLPRRRTRRNTPLML